MTEQILKLIYNITKDHIDPVNKLKLDDNNKNLSIISKNGNINISLLINPADKDKYTELSKILKNKISNIEGVQSINVVLTSEKASEEEAKIPRFKINAQNIIAIASGKGGVGKSTFAVNLATTLSKMGRKIALLDADIYGPSIPRMMGLSDKPQLNSNKKLIPLEGYGIKTMSIGFLISADTPAIWRGPMVMKALEQMFNGVEWGTLDYLIIDLPPGTGDAQLSLAQNAKLSGSIIISTPQDVALIDARKGINMFNKVNVPILGLVENMSYFICDKCEEKHYIFSNGGAKKEAENSQIPFLGEIPLDKKLRIQSDEGRPSCIDSPDSNISLAYKNIAILVDENFNS